MRDDIKVGLQNLWTASILPKRERKVHEQKATNVRAHETFSMMLSKLIRFKGTKALFRTKKSYESQKI